MDSVDDRLGRRFDADVHPNGCRAMQVPDADLDVYRVQNNFNLLAGRGCVVFLINIRL